MENQRETLPIDDDTKSKVIGTFTAEELIMDIEKNPGLEDEPQTDNLKVKLKSLIKKSKGKGKDTTDLEKTLKELEDAVNAVDKGQKEVDGMPVPQCVYDAQHSTLYKDISSALEGEVKLIASDMQSLLLPLQDVKKDIEKAADGYKQAITQEKAQKRLDELKEKKEAARKKAEKELSEVEEQQPVKRVKVGTRVIVRATMTRGVISKINNTGTYEVKKDKLN